uniref:Ripply transcriptional repressor 1 n=1 Tax=Canis lupus familiaris TaxID=9615 RepID=A0A8C0Z4L3_CANLF
MVKPKLVPKKLKGKQIITKQHDKSNNHIVQVGTRGQGPHDKLPGLDSLRAKCSGGLFCYLKESRGACLWRPWLSSARDLPQWWGKKGIEATGGATGAKVIKAASEFHHPVRLFWPKSRSFDYLYSDGEILLQNFPIQATINLYEDSDDEEEEEEEEKEREEEKKLETDERGGL